jgi:hypothetical protein
MFKLYICAVNKGKYVAVYKTFVDLINVCRRLTIKWFYSEPSDSMSEWLYMAKIDEPILKHFS